MPMVLFHRHRAYRIYKELAKKVSTEEADLFSLKEAIYKKGGKEAYKLAVALRKKSKKARTFKEHLKEGTAAILFALIAATLIRTMWFELYEIPSGSMRPTYQEGDHLVASKISFGINVPIIPHHLYFEPKLVQNGQVVIFSVDNMDVVDPDTTYFLLFPGKRMLIKRMIGRPGDSLYFYGGKIYGAKADGGTFVIEKEHVPYINFEGRPSFEENSLVFSQSGLVMGKITPGGVSNLYEKDRWVQGDYFGARFGLENYAMVKMVGDELEIASFPSLKAPLIINGHLLLQPTIARLPLQKIHKERLWQALSTARFTVKEGRVSKDVILKGVPDGTYQMIRGRFEEITFDGRAVALNASHPLYNKEFLPLFFNSGFDFVTFYTTTTLPIYPQRFAYFDQGALKISDALIYEESDALLQKFVADQQGKDHPFIDQKPDLSPAFIKEHGLHVPEKMYYVLGDNYSMSADSRDFGFVPEDNLRGTPSFIFWPPGERLGPPDGPQTPWMTLPHMIMWTVILGVSVVSWRYYYRIPYE